MTPKHQGGRDAKTLRTRRGYASTHVMRRSRILALCVLGGCNTPTEEPAESLMPKATAEPQTVVELPVEQKWVAPPSVEQASVAPPSVQQPSVQQPSVEPPHRSVIETRVEPYETFVDIHPVGVTAPQWSLRVQQHALQLTWDRTRTLDEQTAEVGAMLEELQTGYPDAIKGATVRLGLSTFDYPEFVERLARYALHDPQWKPRPGKLHAYIVQVTREHSFHSELDAVFAAIDRQPKLDGVEKCSTAQSSSRDELGAWLREHDIPANAPVPVGCLMAWFSLKNELPPSSRARSDQSAQSAQSAQPVGAMEGSITPSNERPPISR